MKRIYLIDCPGVVPPSTTDTPQDILLRGVVRVENVEHPEQYIPAVLAKTKPQHIERTYQLKGYKDHIHFLELLARKGGRLLHGGEPDVDGVAKMVLNDFLRGKIPWYTPPPVIEGAEEKGIEGREGRLGEMGKKRKRDDATSVADASTADLTSVGPDGESNADEELDFEGFDSDGGADLENSEAEEEDDDENSETYDVSDSDSEVAEDEEAEGTDEAAEEQLQEEFHEEADVVEQITKPQPKKRRKA
jgi:nuclear GTP-binding protein